MKIYLTDRDMTVEITCKPWTGSGFGPDCFDDLETCVPQEHDKLPGDNAYCMTSEEYKKLVKAWASEIDRMNNREGEYEELGGDELILFWDDLDGNF